MRAISLTTVRHVIAEFPDEIDLQEREMINRLRLLIDRPLTDPQELIYAETLLNYAGEIIRAEPGDLLIYQELFDGIIAPDLMESMQHQQLRDDVLDALRYKHWRKVFYPVYFEKIGIKSCVYCNAQATLAIKRRKKKLSDKDEIQAKFQVDHYLPKKVYPCFSISLHNLYPVCGNCNNVKGTHKVDFNLYEELPTRSSFNFSLRKGSQAEYLLTRKLEDIHICLDSPASDESKGFVNYSKLFELEGIYNQQKDVAEELILKAEVYTAAYKNTLASKFPGIFTTEIIDRLLTGNYTNEVDMHKRPLAKFVRDISIDVGLIKKPE
ncbi:hypothetical protein [Mucilaginibacter sp.]|uniref:hypothetical protein n=1 Tax=Mucilaginibacter sp. TaxID=1882438 RepID=UPI003D134ABF